MSRQDWGTTPAAIDSCLTVCDEFDVQANIHTDTLNESGFVEGKVFTHCVLSSTRDQTLSRLSKAGPSTRIIRKVSAFEAFGSN
jgi:hypothetical protein